MTVSWSAAQLARGSVALLFPLLWLAGPRPLLAIALPLTLAAYLLGRAAAARGGFSALPIAGALTPFGEALLVAGAVALASALVATRELIAMGPVAAAVAAGAVLVVHGPVLRRVERAGAELSRRRKKLTALCGLAGELTLAVVLLAIAAQAHNTTLAGPIEAMQLVVSPWPAVLGLALAYLPMVRLSLVECERERAPRRAAEAASIMLMGVLLVGLGGPSWWP